MKLKCRLPARILIFFWPVIDFGHVQNFTIVSESQVLFDCILYESRWELMSVQVLSALAGTLRAKSIELAIFHCTTVHTYVMMMIHDEDA